jgi:hypothetical protein
VRRVTLHDDVGRELALEHRPREERLAVGRSHAGHVGHERPPQARRERRREVAGLIRVGEDDVAGRRVGDEGRQGLHEPVGRVRLERLVLQQHDLAHRRRRELPTGRGHVGARHDHHDRRTARELLGRRDHLPRRPVQPAATLFGDDEDHESLTGKEPLERLASGYPSGPLASDRSSGLAGDDQRRRDPGRAGPRPVAGSPTPASRRIRSPARLHAGAGRVRARPRRARRRSCASPWPSGARTAARSPAWPRRAPQA